MKRTLRTLRIAAHLFDDPSIRIRRRPLDMRWQYEFPRELKLNPGFNPFHGAVYVARRSALSAWLRGGAKRDRVFNERDRLVRELFFAIHDALHVWAVHWIRHLEPELGYATAPVTRSNFEDLVFCHLLTETVATVGLDYWYLCDTNLNEECDLGTLVEAGLTTPYRRRDLAEYRRFDPTFAPHRPAFFSRLFDLYSNDTITGFSIDDARRSPILTRFVEKELQYSRAQRVYFREWLSYLAGAARPTKESARRSLSTDAAWKRRLVSTLKQLLWRKITTGDVLAAPVRRLARPWTAPQALRRPDFRFVNALTAELYDREPADRDHSLQYIFNHDHASVPEKHRAAIAAAHDAKQWRKVARLLRGARRLPPEPGDPIDVFHLS